MVSDLLLPKKARSSGTGELMKRTLGGKEEGDSAGEMG